MREGRGGEKKRERGEGLGKNVGQTSVGDGEGHFKGASAKEKVGVPGDSDEGEARAGRAI